MMVMSIVHDYDVYNEDGPADHFNDYGQECQNNNQGDN